MWTPARIKHLLETNPIAVERAILCLFRRQTSDEQAARDTRYTNQRGFSAAHARRGSYYAWWLQNRGHLNEKHLAKARHIVLRYTGQLADEANANAANK